MCGSVGKEKEPRWQLTLMTRDLGTTAYSVALGSWLTLSVFVNWRLVCSNPQEFLLPPLPSGISALSPPTGRNTESQLFKVHGDSLFCTAVRIVTIRQPHLAFPCRTEGSGKVPTSLFAVKEMRWQGWELEASSGKFSCTQWLEGGCCGADGPSDLNPASLPPDTWAVSTQAKSLVMGRSSRLSF